MQCFEALTASLLIRSIPTIVHKVTDPHVLHTHLCAQAVEVCVLGTLRHCWGHRTVVERDIVKGGDPVIHTKTDLRQGNLEGLGEASQLNSCPVPLVSLVVQSPPYESVVFDSFNPKVHICSPNRYACVIMPEGEDRDER